MHRDSKDFEHRMIELALSYLLMAFSIRCWLSLQFTAQEQLGRTVTCSSYIGFKVMRSSIFDWPSPGIPIQFDWIIWHLSPLVILLFLVFRRSTSILVVLCILRMRLNIHILGLESRFPCHT